jgi:hypothetical protein
MNAMSTGRRETSEVPVASRGAISSERSSGWLIGSSEGAPSRLDESFTRTILGEAIHELQSTSLERIVVKEAARRLSEKNWMIDGEPRLGDAAPDLVVRDPSGKWHLLEVKVGSADVSAIRQGIGQLDSLVQELSATNPKDFSGIDAVLVTGRHDTKLESLGVQPHVRLIEADGGVQDIVNAIVTGMLEGSAG